MSSRSTQRNLAADHAVYAVTSQPISVLAQSLGLGPDVSLKEVKDAVKDLLKQAGQEGGVLSLKAKEAARLIDCATRPQPGTFDLLEVRPVTFNNDVAGPNKVKEAIAFLRGELSLNTLSLNTLRDNTLSLNLPPQSLVPSCDSVNLPGPAHIGELMPKAFSRKLDPRKLDPRVVAFESALEYLKKFGIIVIPANPANPAAPAPEVTQKLAKHFMAWTWNSETGSWHPKLDTARNQSLFTASLQYLNTISAQRNNARDQFIVSMIRARRVQDNPRYLAEQGIESKLLISDLRTVAQACLGREVSLPMVMRLEALCNLLVATRIPDTDS